MNSLFLSPKINLLFFTELFLLLILSVAFFHTIVILKGWKPGETTNRQYGLEKRSYLVTTVITAAFFIKVALLPFFIYTINDLALIIPGAMCAAGVVWANGYGTPVLFVKISTIILTSLWLSVNRQDNISIGYPYFRKKMWFFISLYILMIAELALEFIFLSKQSTQTPVLCCSSIFTDMEETRKGNLPFGLSTLEFIMIFYLSYIGVIISAHKKNKIFLSIFTTVFVYSAYYSIVYFFGIYIYELPTHKCPFCLFQAEYHHIGYLIFGSLFISVYYATGAVFFDFMDYSFKKVKIWFTFFTIVSSFSFIKYLLINGSFL